MRASNEGLPVSSIVLGGSGRGCPLLRASNEHILIVRVLRARRAPGRPLPIPSEAARWTSTESEPPQPITVFLFPLPSQGHEPNGSPTAPVERALALSLSTISMGEWPASSQRARVGRGPSEGARSASTESGRPLPHHRRPMMMDQQPLIPDALEEIRG